VASGSGTQASSCRCWHRDRDSELEAPESRRRGIGQPLAQSTTNEIDFGDLTRAAFVSEMDSELSPGGAGTAAGPVVSAVVAMARKSVIWGFGRNDDRQLAATA
jgi:hypothetical protein